jgi:hypothetical protein
LSTTTRSLKRSGFAAGASGAIGLAVFACLPADSGFAVWQEAQLHSAPCVALKNASPRWAEKPLTGEPAARASASKRLC